MVRIEKINAFQPTKLFLLFACIFVFIDVNCLGKNQKPKNSARNG
jgi:hypothetical protein